MSEGWKDNLTAKYGENASLPDVMPNMKDVGSVHFMPAESFEDPNFGLTREQRADRDIESLIGEFSDTPPQSSPPPTTKDWPLVVKAIERNGLFVIETETPEFKAMLRFNPKQQDAGDYEIHYRLKRNVEKGRTTKVIEVAKDYKDFRLSMLAQFPIRYLVVTLESVRPHARKAWRVGLTEVQSVAEEDEIND